jgi:putative methionine-R-sulfoxide reductase with GAF domain
LTRYRQRAKLQIEISLHCCMDTYSILDKKLTQAPPQSAPKAVFSNPASKGAGGVPSPAIAREALRFPGEDGGKSLTEMAQRDLDATLQLLAERAQYITGASGAAIALREGENMVCRASAGASAPELGTHLQIDSGLSAESVRTRQTLHCDDAENDPRVNRESCRALGIASVVVMPLVRDEEVYGVFELLAGGLRAFEERDFIALQRLSEMIQTALEHSDTARRAEKHLTSRPEAATTAGAKIETGTKIEPGPTSRVRLAAAENSVRTPEKQIPATENKAASGATSNPRSTHGITPAMTIGKTKPEDAKDEALQDLDLEDLDEHVPISPIAHGKVRSCAACGFPVSEGRRLCLDCEAVAPIVEQGSEAHEFLDQLSDSNSSWIRSHVYLIATVLLVAATIAVVVWRF